METIREAALRYHDLGWHPLELPADAKWPPPSGRTGTQGRDMTRGEVEVAEWGGNLGVRMPVDVIGLDVDVYKGGGATLEDLLVRCGPLPDTWISHSGRDDGSGIRFYRVPIMRWIAGLPGLEIVQRHHRYAAVYPSVHPDGRNYGTWDQHEDEPTTWLPAVEDLPELPWRWIAALARASADDDGASVVAAEGDEVRAFLAVCTDNHEPAYLSVIVAHFTERVDAGYSRHDTAQHCLIWACECARAGVFPATVALKALSMVWAVVLRPEEARRAELTSTARVTEWEAMVRYAVGKVNAKTPEEILARSDEIVGFTVNLDTLPDAGTATPPVAGDTLELVDWTAPPPQHEDLVDGLVVPGRWLQLVTPAKVGKSSLLMYVAVELSEGRDPWDATPVEPVTVLYCDGEQGEEDLRELITDLGHDPGTLTRLHVTLTRPRLDTVAGAARLLHTVEHLGARLVVLDGLNGYVTPEASDNDDNTWKPLYQYAIAPLKARGVAVVSGDNTGKDTTKGSRGSSVKTDKADGVLVVKREEEGVVLHVSHGRGGAYLSEDLHLRAEGFDRSTPIRYWRGLGGWPAGTKEAAELLDALGAPPTESRRKARTRLREAALQAEADGTDPEQYRMRNELLGAALRYRSTIRGPLGDH